MRKPCLCSCRSAAGSEPTKAGIMAAVLDCWHRPAYADTACCTRLASSNITTIGETSMGVRQERTPSLTQLATRQGVSTTKPP